MAQPALTSINPAVLQNKNKANWLEQSGMYTRFQEYTQKKNYGMIWSAMEYPETGFLKKFVLAAKRTKTAKIELPQG